MTYFDTALDDVARRRVRQLGGTDIVVGLPAYKNGRTIAGVMTALAEGIRQSFPEARGLLVRHRFDDIQAATLRG